MRSSAARTNVPSLTMRACVTAHVGSAPGAAGAHPSSYAGPGITYAGGVPQPMPDLAYALQRPEPPSLSLSYSSPSKIAMLNAQAAGGPGGRHAVPPF